MKSGLLGVALGDAIGVPVEFFEQFRLDKNPVKEMMGYGTHHQPVGTWSDDSSLTFCLAESLLSGFDLNDMASKFIRWQSEAYWAARGEVFDIGITTNNSINELRVELSTGKNELHLLRYAAKESDNGNGSLMRIFPLLPEFAQTIEEERFEKVWNVSALTHKHIRAAISCYIYLSFLEILSKEPDKMKAYAELRIQTNAFFLKNEISADEIHHFDRLIKNNICDLERGEVRSGGYVIETLEASIWSFLTTDNFSDAVLKAVNLGHDTDTTGAVTGGIAGFYYGMDALPEFWVVQLARMEDIFSLGDRLEAQFNAS